MPVSPERGGRNGFRARTVRLPGPFLSPRTGLGIEIECALVPTADAVGQILPPLPGLHPLSASFSPGLRHGPHSVAARRLVADRHQEVFIALADILPPPRGFECLRPARAGRLWPTAPAVGMRQLLTLQPASAGDRNLTSNRQFFLSPLPGLHSLSASFSHGLRHGPHSVAATRLVAQTCHVGPRLLADPDG